MIRLAALVERSGANGYRANAATNRRSAGKHGRSLQE